MYLSYRKRGKSVGILYNKNKIDIRISYKI